MRAQLGALAAVLAVATMVGCSDDSGDLEAFCAEVTDTERFEAVFEGLEPADVESASARFQEALTAEEQLREDAPEAVRPDIDVLVRFLEDVVEGLEAEGETGRRPAVYDELRPRFDQVEAASARVATYVEANC